MPFSRFECRVGRDRRHALPHRRDHAEAERPRRGRRRSCRRSDRSIRCSATRWITSPSRWTRPRHAIMPDDRIRRRCFSNRDGQTTRLATSVSSSMRHEHHALGRARLLSHEHQPGDRHALAVASRLQIPRSAAMRRRVRSSPQESDRDAGAASDPSTGNPRRPRGPCVIGVSATSGSIAFRPRSPSRSSAAAKSGSGLVAEALDLSRARRVD